MSEDLILSQLQAAEGMLKDIDKVKETVDMIMGTLNTTDIIKTFNWP